ncbi:MAG: AAA family ATPase, partial [Bacteroides sp.]
MYAPRRMPIGTQSFEDIRKKELLYIDKTRYI